MLFNARLITTILVVILASFILLHWLGLSIPYHQDEYKWVLYSHPEIIPPGTIPHPPLTEFIYTKIGPLVGDDHFRLIPSVFGLANIFLVFYLARLLFGRRAAIFAATLFTVSFYSLLASLTVDVDGAVMPFFFLLLVIGYCRAKASGFADWRWIGLGLVGLIGGFLVKVSFLLAPAAVAFDWAVAAKVFSNRSKLFKYLLTIAALLGGLILILLGAKWLFPFFDLSKAFRYWEHFAVWQDRGWFQIFIQFSKAILYTSPLLIMPVFLARRETWRRARMLFIFVLVGTLFYLFAFDFSLGALDRYFAFLIVPLVIITGAVFDKEFLEPAGNKSNRQPATILFFVAVIVFLTQFLGHEIVSLHPKTEWLTRIISGKWNFLFPFSGGSGPLPFYVSFLFIAVSWLLAVLFLVLALRKRSWRKLALVGILAVGLSYNAVFIEEYLFGWINGSARILVEKATIFIASSPEISKVVVYNDNGGFGVKQTGKYARRFYAAPQFESVYREFFSNYSGHLLYVDIPRIEPGSVYEKYLSACELVHRDTSRRITASIFYCQPAVAGKILSS